MRAAGLHFPDDLHYLVEHQVWARLESDGTATVGITALGIAQAGEIYMCRPKWPGSVIEQGRSIAVVIMIEMIFLIGVFAEIFTTTGGGPGNGMPRESGFDIVVASNVLHASHDIARAAGHAATLVAPDTIVTAAHCLFLRGREIDAGKHAELLANLKNELR